MPKLIDLTQGTSEWHEWRAGKITASLAPIVMGLSPYCTPLQLFDQMLGLADKPEATPAMRRGSKLEGLVRSMINERSGFNYQPVCMESSDTAWMAASLDGWDGTLESYRALEIKCPSKENHKIAFMGEVPAHYFPQLQHMMVVSETEYCLYASYGPDGTLHQVNVKRDDKFIKKMMRAEKEFYDRLAAFDPPDPTPGKDLDTIVDPEAIEMAKRYRYVMYELERFESQKENLRQQLILKAEGRSVIVDDLKIMKIPRRGNVDYSKIECLKALDLNQYRKPMTVSWRIA
jgi:putative phage-type endonuclease